MSRKASTRFFITDDNFVRNKDWEAILDRLIHLREAGKLRIKFTIQVDTLCHRLPNFIEKAARAGVKRVFIGLESINPDNSHRRQETTKQNHGVSQDAACLEASRRADLLRLHYRVSK